MNQTVVIHVREADFAAGDIYVGRASPRKGLKASPYHNPFKIGVQYTREEAVAAFGEWVRTSLEPLAVWIREHVHELVGHRIVCWCEQDELCHARDVLVPMAEAAWKARQEA